MALRICDWKYGKRWVYSITYDEALVDLHRFAIPLHEEYGIPGHVEVVAGQIGTIRQIGNSSYNGMRHMDSDELRDMLRRGWGVGNHSWSHQVITPDMLDRELREARDIIEEAINTPIMLFCSPGDNTNMANHVLTACRDLGYLGAMSITDALNRPTDELFWINRSPLHDSFYEPFFSEFDPYRNLRHAESDGGWVIDYCHCPLEEPIHPHKDCSQQQLRERFEAVLGEGGQQVWCAVPEEVIYYHLCRRHLMVETIVSNETEQRYRLSLPGLNARVVSREITLEVDVPTAWCCYPKVSVNGQIRSAELVSPRVLRTTVSVDENTELCFGAMD